MALSEHPHTSPDADSPDADSPGTDSPRADSPGAASPGAASPGSASPGADDERLLRLQGGRFVIERRLGKGGFGVVHQAYDRQRNVHLALKSLTGSDVASIYDLKNEFRTLAGLSHPNLVSLYDLFGEGDQWFIAMELVRGTDFLRYVSNDLHRDDASPSDLTATVARRLWCDLERLEVAMSQLVQALIYLHGQGKLHRDVKPSNVLITEHGQVKLVDFGLTTDVAHDPDGETVRFRGTPAYVSPEQAAGEPASEASDWYSVGVILYEALTGQRPFTGSFAQVLEAKQHRQAPAPAAVCEGVPAALDALCRDLLERDPTRRPSDAEVLSRVQRIWPPSVTAAQVRPRRRRSSPFVGRQPHLDVLQRAFAASLAGRAQAVYVHGGSGMGKTALVRVFLERLRERSPEAVILEGRCYERESVPYKALDSLVDCLSRYLKKLPRPQAEALLPRDVPALTRLFPILRRVDAVSQLRHRPVDVANAQELRRRGFAAFGELLARLADRHPVVLVIDDLQWGDADSASLLADLVSGGDPPPVLFIACYRSEEAFTSSALRTLLFPKLPRTVNADVHQVLVDQLTESESNELAASLCDTYGATTPASIIVHESGGSPFFMNELVQYSAGLASAAAAAGGSGSPVQLPELRLDSVIAARIGRLGDGERRLLQVLAIVGGPLWLSVAAEVADLPRGALEEVTLLRSVHLTRTRLGRAGEEIELYHDRTRQAVLALIPEAERRRWHARLATVLERSAHADPETLMVHFRAAGQNDAASRYAAIAADRARDALAFERAAHRYRLALELGEFDDARRRDLQVKLGDALAASGRGHDAAQAYLSASEGALAAELLELKRRAAEQLLRSGHIDEGMTALRAVLDTLHMKLPTSPAGALFSLLVGRARIWLRGMDFQERDRSQLSAAELVRVDACWSVAMIIGVVDTIRGADFQARHVLLALESGDPHRIARALAVEIAYAALHGSRTHARQQDLTARAQALAERVARPDTLALVTLARGAAAFFQGNWKTAHELLARAEPMLRECSGVAWELNTTYLYDLLALFYLGEVKELAARLPTFLREACERDDRTAATNLRTRTTYIMHLAADNPARARKDVQQGMASWGHSGFHAQHSWELYAQGEIDLYTGHGLAAWNRITERWTPLRRSLLLRIQGVRIESRYLRARSALLAAMESPNGQSSPATLLRSAKRDAVRLEREGAGWASAFALLIRSGIATLRGNRSDAIARLQSAEAAFRELSMQLHAAVALRRRGELLGGSEGALLIQQADTWMATQQIRNPARMAGMLAPGAYAPS